MSTGASKPGSAAAAKVFITYRREETAAHAGRLYDAMVARFGEANVFMDVDMAPGVDFVERITEAVAACHVLIVVMGPRWATVADEQGTPRLADPEDFVRLEVETALQRSEVTPIPVLVAGARMPKREDLPPEVRAITRRNALELGDQRWRDDVGRLISTLDELLAASPLVPGSQSAERSVATRKAEQTAPPSTVAGPTSAETKLAAAPRAGAGRLWRWALLGAGAIAAIVIAVVVAVDGGGPSTQAATFTKADLPDLVFPDDDPPGALRLDASEPFTTGNAQGYGNKFVPLKGSAKPYWYSASTATVFEDEGAAQSALDSDKGSKQGENFEPISARGLGDDGFAVFVTGLPQPKNFEGSWKGSDYHYAWRIGNLVQVFDLSLSGPGVSEATARGFANTMEALTE